MSVGQPFEVTDQEVIFEKSQYTKKAWHIGAEGRGQELLGYVIFDSVNSLWKGMERLCKTQNSYSQSVRSNNLGMRENYTLTNKNVGHDS